MSAGADFRVTNIPNTLRLERIACTFSAESTERDVRLGRFFGWVRFVDFFFAQWADADWIPSFDVLLQEETGAGVRSWKATCTRVV